MLIKTVLKSQEMHQVLSIGELRVQSQLSRTKDHADHAGPSQLLDLWNQLTISSRELWEISQNNSSLIVQLLSEIKDATED